MTSEEAGDRYTGFCLTILITILAAILYGEVHDQITIRICPEYFTIAHPQVSDTTSLTKLAFIWGFLATWWVGLLLGIPLAICAHAGSRPPFPLRRLLPPIASLLVVMAACAGFSGMIGMMLFMSGHVQLNQHWLSVIPQRHMLGFICDCWTHLASYLCGFIAGIVLMVWVWRQRGLPEFQRSDLATGRASVYGNNK
jgi:hypothetical protein